MTTDVADTAPQPTPEPLTPARQARFAPVWRATGHRRLVGAVIADGTRDGQPARITLPVERVAIARVGYRSFDSDFTLNVSSAHIGLPPALETTVITAAKAAARAVGLRGKAEVRLTVPTAKDSGADLASAATYATIDALFTAADISTPAPLAKTVTDAAAIGPRPVANDIGFGIHHTGTGRYLAQFDAPRFSLLVCHRPGSRTSDLTGVGSLPAVEMPADPAAAAAWLMEANGTATSPVAGTLAGLLSEPGVYGLVGGHTDTDPVAVLLADGPDTLTMAQQLRPKVSAAVKAAHPGWHVTYTRQGLID